MNSFFLCFLRKGEKLVEEKTREEGRFKKKKKVKKVNPKEKKASTH